MARDHPETAVITVCTNRPQYARIMLDHLDRQDSDFHIYVVLNSSNASFCCGLVDYCSHLEHPVTLIRLWSMTTQIGLVYNCGLWHALRRDYKRIVKMDDDVAIKKNGISELHGLCDKGDCVGVLLPYSHNTGHYQYRMMMANRIHDTHKFLYGACFMFPRVLHTAIGFFSEDAQRGMDLDYGVRAQTAGWKVVNHRAFRALHLGTMNGTEVTPEGKKSRKYCKFGEVLMCTTIWDRAEVRQALIAQVFGETSRT